MSGTIPLSLSQQLDQYGQPLNGGKLYIIQAGTVSTPQDSFQDPGLTPALKLPNPITLDAAGRLPQFFLADASNGASGFIKIRLTDSAGVVQREADGIQIIGPSGGTGGGGTAVDPNALIQTGNIIARYAPATVALAGYIRLNGSGIGSATSGAAERANADCQPLFIYLWGADPTLQVLPSRGATALADWTANKILVPPDWRGYALGALDNMGGALGAAGRLTPAFFGADATVLGAVGGGESFPLALAHLPTLAYSGTTQTDYPDHTHIAWQGAPGAQKPNSGGTAPFDTNVAVQSGGASARHQHNFSINFGTGNQAHRTVGPRKLCTFYMKL
jgi:hypothetical protein